MSCAFSCFFGAVCSRYRCTDKQAIDSGLQRLPDRPVRGDAYAFVSEMVRVDVSVFGEAPQFRAPRINFAYRFRGYRTGHETTATLAAKYGLRLERH